MTKRKSPAGKLAGKKVAFVGKFPYRLDRYQAQTVAAGAEVVHPAQVEPDYVVIGEGRGGKPPGDVAKLQKRYPSAQALEVPDFFRLMIPTRDELLKMIATRALDAPSPSDSTRWEPLNELLWWANATIDLSGADLHGAYLFAAHMERIVLDGANLSGTSVKYLHPGTLKGVNLDGCDGENLYLANAEDCTFRGANLEKIWAFWGSANRIERCDFTDAKIARGRFESHGGMVRQCVFQRADLSGGELQRSTFEACDFTEANLSGLLANGTRFPRSIFHKANLSRADLRGAALVGADLSGADLREAVLNGADLTDAKVDGADFTGAILTGVNLANVDTSKAKNLLVPAVHFPGPHVLAFTAVAMAATDFHTMAEVDLGGDQFVKLGMQKTKRGVYANCRHYRGEDDVHVSVTAPTFEQGLLNLAERWPGATLRLDTISAKGGRTKPDKLRELALAAWCEAFGFQASAEDQTRVLSAQADAARSETLALIEKIRTEGISAWSSIDFRVQERYKDFSGADLSGLDLYDFRLDNKNLTGANFQGTSLIGVHLSGAKLVGANFTQAVLSHAYAWGADASGANFERANLQGAQLDRANLSGANLRGANLTDADLSGANLRGADLIDSNLTDANLKGAEYDEHTNFSAGFTPLLDMIWHGPARTVAAAHAPGTLAFADFFAGLGDQVDPSRLSKTLAMLKKERFRLFAEFTDEAVVGIVRSQSSEELAYSCRLAKDGTYYCGTQNQKPCGGLRGGLCKHLLVLVIGLTRSGDLDPATVDGWLDSSRSKKASLDKSRLSETFLRYVAAEEGTIDWRPTETVPEDYYAL